MKMLTLAAAAALGLAAVPAMAQQFPNSPPAAGGYNRSGAGGTRDVGNGQAQPAQGYQNNAYVRRPSSRTPTDVGNMAFPDPSLTPAGNMPPVPVGR